jgi:hypothetical protein
LGDRIGITLGNNFFIIKVIFEDIVANKELSLLSAMLQSREYDDDMQNIDKIICKMKIGTHSLTHLLTHLLTHS